MQGSKRVDWKDRTRLTVQTGAFLGEGRECVVVVVLVLVLVVLVTQYPFFRQSFHWTQVCIFSFPWIPFIESYK